MVSTSLKSIVMHNMTGSATRFTVGVQGRSLSLNGLCGPCLDADVHVPSYRVGVGGVFSGMCVRLFRAVFLDGMGLCACVLQTSSN